MPKYFYTAKTADGETRTGNASAVDQHQLAQILKDDGMILIKATSDIKEKKKGWSLFSKGKASAAEKILMTRNLWVMNGTGLSLVKSFDVLAIQARNKNLKKALLDIKEKINKGNSLSTAMSYYPDVFSDLYVSMVKIGEEAGTLEEIFENLSLQMEKEHELRSKVQNAMIYPAIILLTMMGVGVILVAVVIPQLNTFFGTLGADLPIYTKIILGAGNFAAKQWPFLVVAPFVLAGILVAMLKTRQGKKTIDTVLLRLPFVSLLVKENDCALLIRSLSSLIASGVPIVRSLEVSSGIVGNFYFKRAVEGALEKIKKGENLSGALRSYKDIFPFGMTEMIEVGEETGKTSTILKKLAEFYEQEVISATEKLSVAIEPVLIVVLGVSVGVFAFSIIQPMYSVLSSIG